MVLTDYCMPEMTGYDLLKAIKVYLFLFLKKKKGIPISFFSTFVLSVIILAGRRRPMPPEFPFCDSILIFHGRFQAMSPLKPIPVIVMSSENEPQRISR